MTGKAQVSMEYLVVFAFAVLLIVPLILIYNVQTKNVQSDVSNAQVYRVLTKISDSAEDIYYQGPPAKKTIRISFPKGIESIVVNQSYIEATYYGDGGLISVTKDSMAELNGTIRPFSGEHTISFTAQNNTVQIDDKE